MTLSERERSFHVKLIVLSSSKFAFFLSILLVLNAESNSRSSIMVYVVVEYVYLGYELENWHYVILVCIAELKLCTARLHETSRRDEQVRDSRRDLLGRDRDETLVRLDTVSRPRRRDRDHIPAVCPRTPNSKTKKRRNIKIGVDVLYGTSNRSAKFHSKKVKGQRHRM